MLSFSEVDFFFIFRKKNKIYLDGNEVSLTFVSDGLGEQRLSTSGRAVEQHSARGLHAEFKVSANLIDKIIVTK